MGNSWIPRMYSQALFLMLGVVINEAVTPPIKPQLFSSRYRYFIFFFFLLCCDSLGNRKPRCPSLGEPLAPRLFAHVEHVGWALSQSVLTLGFSSPSRREKTKAQITGEVSLPPPVQQPRPGLIYLCPTLVIAVHGERI